MPCAWRTDSNDSDCQLSLDLMFVLDGSYMVGNDNFQLLKTWVVDVATKLLGDGGDNTQLGVVQYSFKDTQ